MSVSNIDKNSSPARDMPEDVSRIINEINFEEDIDSPFDDLDVERDITLPTRNQINLFMEKQSRELPSSPLSDVTNKPTKSRKRKRNVDGMKRNILKRCRNQGESYCNQRGIHRARIVHASCGDGCAYMCNKTFSESDREIIHKAFWSLDSNAKLNFYGKFTKQTAKARTRTKSKISRRNDTYEYFFEKNSVLFRVCKLFFLNTLDVSQNRIYYYYRSKHLHNVGLSKPRNQGIHTKYKIPEDQLNGVREHIKKIPVIDSHYCCANSSKQYLETGLNLNKMYKFYINSTENPVKLHMYSKIFNEEFNYSFYKPKKDQCDRCVQFQLLNSSTDVEKKLFDSHRLSHSLAKSERDGDRNMREDTTAVICYDLQNVFSVPKANVSSFFYKRKFSVYNLTGHCNKNNVTYCSIWHEGLSGRSGNDIASALIKILENVVKNNPTVAKLVFGLILAYHKIKID